VPPGLMIALMGMSFAFLGTALDKILHPKLKTR
jgi:peptide/nickel transport system permease protein